MLTKLYAKVQGWQGSDEGATALEYAILAALIAVVIIAALLLLGPQLAKVFDKITGELGKVAP